MKSKSKKGKQGVAGKSPNTLPLGSTVEHRLGAGEFKAHCLKLMDEVQQTRQPIVITKHGKPVAKLVPFEEASEEPLNLFGCMKGTAIIVGDIMEPIDVKWNAMYE